jgi:peptidoglycan hydrolase CwlO-like protein
MEKISLIIAVGLLFFSAPTFGQEVYKWVDEKGIVHFTDDLGQVPEKYRGQIQKEAPPMESTPSQPASPPPIESPKSMEPGKEIGPAPGPKQKDILGRGEDWWRAKVNEWNEKLNTSQRNYEAAYSEWKSKENELETAKFKPESLKRKLKAEMKVLEEKVKDCEKRVGEAKNMLEKVLPKEAEDYRANPEWLKIQDRK